MAWPSPVMPGDEILAEQYDALLGAIRVWGGPVNANGFALSNLSSLTTNHLEVDGTQLTVAPGLQARFEDEDGTHAIQIDCNPTLQRERFGTKTGQLEFFGPGSIIAFDMTGNPTIGSSGGDGRLHLAASISLDAGTEFVIANNFLLFHNATLDRGLAFDFTSTEVRERIGTITGLLDFWGPQSVIAFDVSTPVPAIGATSSDGALHFALNGYFLGTVSAVAFNPHGSGSSQAEVAQAMLQPERTKTNGEYGAPVGAWNLVMEDDGLHVLAKKSDTELKVAVIPWSSSITA